jgi:tRNA-splicing ligase RtcB (3'-phosphate/5'-hydroxy nucleic acid ligase)
VQVIAEQGKLPIKAWVDGVELEDEARVQLLNVAGMPFIHKHIAVMPDVHWGMGATVGSVIPTVGAIIPAAVGVDIGCGMMAVRTSLTASDLPDNLHGIRSAIEAAVPHGRSDNGGMNDIGRHNHTRMPKAVLNANAEVGPGLVKIAEKHEKIVQAAQTSPYHMGTLGTGNHFIEVCLDEEQRVWFMLHSGSRGIGNKIGTYFIEKAKEEMRRWFINLPDADLAYIPEGSALFSDYMEGLHWAQGFARKNRETMMALIIAAVKQDMGIDFEAGETAVNCHHNYVNKEHHFGKNVWLTRKGAVRARQGDMGVIPGSMGVRSFIVRGRGNEQSFCSCSHGAGRKMSRTQAKKLYSVADHVKATEGVECKKDESVIDETPMAYKDIDAVMAAQSDLVEIVHTLKQVVCIKG